MSAPRKSKPVRPAYTITEAISEAQRVKSRFSAWVVSDGERSALIEHLHRATARKRRHGGAWYRVSVADKHARVTSVDVESRDFSAAITAALDLIGGER